MPRTVFYRPAADRDVTEAFQWYSARDRDLGVAFVNEIERVEAILAAHPLLYQRFDEDIRRASLHRFPYALFYIVEADRIVVLGCLHQHRKPPTGQELLHRS